MREKQEHYKLQLKKLSLYIILLALLKELQMKGMLYHKKNLSPKTVIHPCTSKDTSTHVTDVKKPSIISTIEVSQELCI